MDINERLKTYSRENVRWVVNEVMDWATVVRALYPINCALGELDPNKANYTLIIAYLRSACQYKKRLSNWYPCLRRVVCYMAINKLPFRAVIGLHMPPLRTSIAGVYKANKD